MRVDKVKSGLIKRSLRVLRSIGDPFRGGSFRHRPCAPERDKVVGKRRQLKGGVNGSLVIKPCTRRMASSRWTHYSFLRHMYPHFRRNPDLYDKSTTSPKKYQRRVWRNGTLSPVWMSDCVSCIRQLAGPLEDLLVISSMNTRPMQL